MNGNFNNFIPNDDIITIYIEKLIQLIFDIFQNIWRKYRTQNVLSLLHSNLPCIEVHHKVLDDKPGGVEDDQQ